MKFLITYPEEKGAKILKDLKHTSQQTSGITSRWRDKGDRMFKRLPNFVKKKLEDAGCGLQNWLSFGLNIKVKEIDKTSCEVEILMRGIANIIGEEKLYKMLQKQAKDYGEGISVEKVD